jgi:hypothetical protein
MKRRWRFWIDLQGQRRRLRHCHFAVVVAVVVVAIAAAVVRSAVAVVVVVVEGLFDLFQTGPDLFYPALRTALAAILFLIKYDPPSAR